MWSDLLTVLSKSSGSPGLPWDSLEDYRLKSVTDSQEADYINCCKIMLMKLDQCSLSAVPGREILLESVVLKKRLELLPFIYGQFADCDESYRRDKLLHLLEGFIYRGKHLRAAFEFIVKRGSSSQVGLIPLKEDEIIRCLINVPSIVGNKLQLKLPQTFVPVNYFTHLCLVIFAVFEKVHRRLRKGLDCKVDFFCHLAGRIASTGYANLTLKHLTSPILDKCSNDFIWRRLSQRLISSQSDINIEPIVRPLIVIAEDPSQLKWFLPSDPSSMPKITYLLTEKFVLNNYQTQNKFIPNLIGYLANVSKELFLKAFNTLLDTWSNATAVKHRPFEQQFHICCGLAMSAKYLKTIDLTEQDRMKFTSRVIYAMQIYLSSVLPEIRFTGLYIGKLLLTILQVDGPNLDLEIEKSPEIETLTELFGSPIHTMKASRDEEAESTEKIEASMEKLTTADEEEEEDEDDFVPYDLSNEAKIIKTKKPIYVPDCISGLRDNENADWNEICLKSASELIEKNRSMIEDYAQDFAISLLHLQDTFELPDFVPLRRDALVKLLTVSPITVSAYLTNQFYDSNLVTERRLLILETLAMASQEITKSSREEGVDGESDGGQSSLKTNLVPNDIVIAEAKWKTVVEDRIMRKTKIISKSRPTAKSYVNKFVPFAGHFFFPLMRLADSPNITFNLSGEDYYLLGRLLYTLGIVLDSASQSPITQRMSKSLIDFLWAFRYHVESFVRQAIIFCVCMIILSAPRTYLIEYMQTDLIEFQKWLLDVVQKDTDKECIERSLNALFLMKQLVEPEET